MDYSLNMIFGPDVVIVEDSNAGIEIIGSWCC
jgi:hypothetical protein